MGEAHSLRHRDHGRGALQATRELPATGVGAAPGIEKDYHSGRPRWRQDATIDSRCSAKRMPPAVSDPRPRAGHGTVGRGTRSAALLVGSTKSISRRSGTLNGYDDRKRAAVLRW